MSSFIKDLFDCDYTLYKEKINYKYPNTGSYKSASRYYSLSKI